MSIRSAIEDVERFHNASSIENLAGNARLDFKKLRRRLLKEEYKETKKAVKEGDMRGVADGYADMIFVILGSALVQIGKYRFIRAWQEVVRSNMAKCIDGKIIMRDDGKVLKPEGWTPPDIRSILFMDEPPEMTPSFMVGELSMAMDTFASVLEQVKTQLKADPESVTETKANLEQLAYALKEMQAGIQELL